MKEFADRLQEIQKQRGLSQKAMAEMIGITSASLSAYMRDAKTPALDIALKIANALGVSIGWLCGELQSSSNMATYEDLTRNIVALVDTSGVNFVLYGGSANLSADTHGFFEHSDPDEVAAYVATTKAAGYNPTQVHYMALETIDDALSSFLLDWARIRKLYINGTVDNEMYEAWLEKRFRTLESIALPKRNPEER